MLTDDGSLAIEVPRDREGSFEPRFIAKHERRFTGFDDKIYTAASADAALTALEAFEHGPWGVRFPTVVAAWRASSSSWDSGPWPTK